MAISPRYVWDNGCAVLRARWYLRHADDVGTRVRLRGRPAVTNHGRMVIGERVQLISTIATLELVSDTGGLLEIGPRTLVNFGCSLVATELVQIGAHCHIGPYTMMLDNDFHRVEPERRLERPPSKPIVVEDNVWIGARVDPHVRGHRRPRRVCRSRQRRHVGRPAADARRRRPRTCHPGALTWPCRHVSVVIPTYNRLDQLRGARSTGSPPRRTSTSRPR